MNLMKNYVCLLFLLIGSAFAQDSYQRLLHHWDYDKSAPLNVKQLGAHDVDGVEVYDIVYFSPTGNRGAFIGPNGGRITASLVVPPGKGPFAAMIFGHWCMPGSDKKNRSEFMDEALVLAHSGVISLLPDHVTVHSGFVENDTPLSVQPIAVEVQQDINLRRGADLLLARKDVDSKRLAYAGHSCDATAGGFLSGIDHRFQAFVLMAGDFSDEVDEKTKALQEYRQKIGPEKFDAFAAKYSWTDPAKYVSHAAPSTVFLQFAADEPFGTADMDKEYFAVVSEPKKMKIYQAPHALNAEATRDRIAFLAEHLSLKPPGTKSVASIPALFQPPWPK